MENRIVKATSSSSRVRLEDSDYERMKCIVNDAQKSYTLVNDTAKIIALRKASKSNK